MQQVRRSVLDLQRGGIIERSAIVYPGARILLKGRMDSTQNQKMQQADVEARRYRIVAALLIVLTVGFGVLGLMDIIHV
jgi:hypothetical protein